MTAGTYGGATFGLPFGLGLGLFIDNHGRAYPQLYGGTPGLSYSSGYTPDLEGLLTGPSISGSLGVGTVRANVGGNTSTGGVGIGTPGVGVTHGFGPFEISNDYSHPWTAPTIRDSVARAGVPSRYNVFEYGYPDPTQPGPFPSPTASSDPSPAPVTSQPNDAPADNKPIRRLGRFTHDPSATSPSDSPSPAPPPAPPQGPLTLNEAHLEYQRGLNAARSQGSAPDAPAPTLSSSAVPPGVSSSTSPPLQTGFATIGPGNGDSPVRFFNPQSPLGSGIGSWPSSVAPAGPQYFPQPAPSSLPSSEQPGGLLGMLMDYLRENPDLQSGAARANAAPR